MKYLKVFTDFKEVMGDLGDAEKGRLFTAMLEYAETGTDPDLRGNERFLWRTAKMQIDRERAYAEKKADAGRIGGSSKHSEADASKQKHSEADASQKDKDKEILKEISPNGDTKKMRELYQDAWFKDFWTMYPRKVDKQDAAKAWKKLNPDEALFQRIMEGLRKWKAYWDARNEPEFVPHPERWLNAARWESEPPEQMFRSVMNAEPKRKKNAALQYEQTPISKQDFDALVVKLEGE